MKLPTLLHKYSFLLAVLLALSACAAPPAALPPTPSEVAASPTPIPTAIPTATLTATAVPTQAPSQVAQILDLAYTGHLWVLAATQEAAGTGLSLFGSKDGGSTWELHPIPGAQPDWVGSAPAPETARHIVFLNQEDGWVYGPGVFATQDGGRTWQQTKMAQQVMAIAPMEGPGAQTWALAGVCPAAGGNCAYKVLVLDTQTGAWQPLTGFTPLSAGPDAALLRPDGHSALMLGQDLTVQALHAPDIILWASPGFGPWKKLSTPCQEQGQLSISPEGQYWLLCGGIPSAGNQGKAVYISADQGQTWELRAVTEFAQSTVTPTATPALHPLPTYGYTDALLALSNNEALIGLGRSTILLTTDGGQNWNEGTSLEATNPGDSSGWRIVRRPNSDELWASVGTGLFHSTDLGKSWNQVNY